MNSYWNNTGAPFPWGKFGIDADLAFTFDFSEFAATAGEGLTVASVAVHPDSHLVIGPVWLNDGEATFRVRNSSAPAKVGSFVPLRMHITLSDGQHDDRTRLLKITPR